MNRPRAASVGGDSPSISRRNRIGDDVDGEVTINPIKGSLCKEKYVESLPNDYAEYCPPPTVLDRLADTSIEFDSLIYQDPSAKASKLKLESIFTDHFFPSNHPTHYHLPPGDIARGKSQQPERLVWKRISEMFQNVEFIHDNKPKPDDVVQGKLGDCWFLGAVATLASSSIHFESVVPKPWPSQEAMNPSDPKCNITCLLIEIRILI